MGTCTLHCCLYISATSIPKRKAFQKLILTLRTIMISQEVGLVAGDFNGTTWRHRGKDNLSRDSVLPTPPGPTSLGFNFGQLGRRLRISQTNGFSPFFGKCMSMVHSPSHGKRSACDQLIKVAIMRCGSTWISWIGATRGPGEMRTSHTFH